MQARIRLTRLSAVVALGLVVVLAGMAFAQPGSSNVGTWKLNVAKSKVSGGSAALSKSATFTVEPAGAGAKVTVDSVSSDGTVRHWAYTADYDGKDNPITGNSPYGDAVSITRIDASTTRNVYKKAGTITITQNAVVSSDGKTIAITVTGTNSLGQAVNVVAVYDKQ
jgi:hypothetical protein